MGGGEAPRVRRGEGAVRPIELKNPFEKTNRNSLEERRRGQQIDEINRMLVEWRVKDELHLEGRELCEHLRKYYDIVGTGCRPHRLWRPK